MKPYACCRGLHATLDALFEVMRETGARSKAIGQMIVHANEQNRVQFDRPQIGNMLDAQFSFQYALAVDAESGRATLDQFSTLRDADPEVKRLMGVTRVVADRTLKPGEYPPLEIRLSDGRTVERHVRFAKGAPENPLSDEELPRKVVSQIEPAPWEEPLQRASFVCSFARDTAGFQRIDRASGPIQQTGIEQPKPNEDRRP